MLGKPKVLYRLLALFFTSTITSASLTGCGYGPPPMPRQTLENSIIQKGEVLTKNVQIHIVDTTNNTLLAKNNCIEFDVMKKSEKKDVL